MARITIEGCLKYTPNRFALVCIAAQRVYDLAKGAPPEVACNKKEAVTALREIAAGKIGSTVPTPPARRNILSNKS